MRSLIVLTAALAALPVIGDGRPPAAPLPDLVAAAVAPPRAAEPAPPPAKPVQVAELAPAPAPVPWSQPVDAVAVSIFDGADVAPEDLPFTRWFWLDDTSKLEEWQALAHALGLLTNNSSLELSPGIVAQPIVRGPVARIDLRWYATAPEDLARLLKLWEDFAFDPSFSLLYTQDALKLLTTQQKAPLRVATRKPIMTKDAEGAWKATGRHRMEFASLADAVVRTPVVKVIPPKLSAAGIERLMAATVSAAPIVFLDYFVSRSLSSVKRSPGAKEKKDTVYDTIWGGRYHELANTPRSQVKGISDLDALLGHLKIGDGKQNFAKVLDGLRSHCRTVMIRSEVTGKRRLTVMVYSPNGNPAVAAPLLAITFDIFDDSVDLGNDPLISFVASVSDAHEVIWLDATGMQRYALYDGAGNLVDEVPIDVATDETVPTPYTKRLDIIGCVRCHGPHAGYQPLKNDLRDIFRYNPRQLLSQEPVTRDKVAGWHSGDVGKVLSRARDDYSAAVLTMTGRWKDDVGQANTVRLSSARLAAIYARAKYDQLDASEVLRRLGQPEPPKGQEVPTLRALLKPQQIRPGVFVLEDLRVDALVTPDQKPGEPLRGKRINPQDWQLVESFVRERIPDRR